MSTRCVDDSQQGLELSTTNCSRMAQCELLPQTTFAEPCNAVFPTCEVDNCFWNKRESQTKSSFIRSSPHRLGPQYTLPKQRSLQPIPPCITITRPVGERPLRCKFPRCESPTSCCPQRDANICAPTIREGLSISCVQCMIENQQENPPPMSSIPVVRHTFGGASSQQGRPQLDLSRTICQFPYSGIETNLSRNPSAIQQHSMLMQTTSPMSLMQRTSLATKRNLKEVPCVCQFPPSVPMAQRPDAMGNNSYMSFQNEDAFPSCPPKPPGLIPIDEQLLPFLFSDNLDLPKETIPNPTSSPPPSSPRSMSPMRNTALTTMTPSSATSSKPATDDQAIEKMVVDIAEAHYEKSKTLVKEYYRQLRRTLIRQRAGRNGTRFLTNHEREALARAIEDMSAKLERAASLKYYLFSFLEHKQKLYNMRHGEVKNE